MVSGSEDLLDRFRALVEEARAAGRRDVLDAVQRMLAEDRKRDPADDDASWHGMIGRSPAITALHTKIERFAAVTSPVLICGESGTGKDLVARILHELGPRRDAPMVSENCAAIPETLLESVLFGHVKGAFTGAVRDHPGHFVSAHGGTLFLDEIGEMSLAMQVKLLRVLQESEVRPVGGEKVRKVDVRIIAATNQDLENAVAEKRFREDLLFRLNVLRLDLPPLRDRGDDVLLLAEHLLRAGCAESGRELELSPAARDAIRAYRWPGNVRQLQNEVQRLIALTEGKQVGADDLSDAVRGEA